MNRTDRQWLSDAAVENGWLEFRNISGEVYCRLTPAGVGHLESLAVEATRSDQVFVAMWFASEMQEAFRDAIEPAVVDAGYRAYKVDLDQEFDQQITDQIFFEIERSRFLIADFTHDKDGARGGVYFEAGYAKGLGLPIIWCKRDDGVSKMHFDTDHYPHIIWKDAADLKTKLAAKIRAFVGQGPLAVGGA